MIKQANKMILWLYQEGIKDGNETLRDTSRETKYNEKGGLTCLTCICPLNKKTNNVSLSLPKYTTVSHLMQT